jgi:NAD(P)-dependent dehydrogenase (short-subunit alcohol dehydrogenase family)
MTYWQDKVAVVTGGSTGLGRSIAEAFAAAGARVVIAARHADALNTTAEEIRRRVGSACPEIVAVPTDVTHQTEVEALFQQTIARFGRLDVLVNNAGRSDRGQVLDTTPEEFEELLELNFLSVVRCTRAAAPELLKSHGHLVNIGSLASKTASRFVGAYPASKFALAAYTQQLRLELSPEGLHVLFVCPGPIIKDEPGNHRPAEKTEGIPDHAKKPGAGVKLGAVHAKDLAQAILKACENRRTELVYPRKARILFMLTQLSPRWGDWLLGRFT